MLDAILAFIKEQVFLFILVQGFIFLLYLNWQFAGIIWNRLDRHFFKIPSIKICKFTDDQGNQYLLTTDQWGNPISTQRLTEDVKLQEK